MSSIHSYTFEDISREFSQFFQVGSLTSSYKPTLLKSILFCLKHNKIKRIDKDYFISIDEIATYFLKFYFTLHRRFKLKQLTSKNHDIAMYRIIDKESYNLKGIKLHEKDISDEILTEIKNTLFRNVVYLLRRDSYFYDFYDSDSNMILIKRNMKDEQEFNQILRDQGRNRNDIEFIGIPESVVLFIEINRPILEAAVNASLARFMEKVNNTPNLSIKILAADGSFNEMRNISDLMKEELYMYQKNICFYCEMDMGCSQEADHFVPYNYLFDSPIWNMVGVCKECNGKKSNHYVQEKFLHKIQERNLEENFRLVFFQDRENSLKYAKDINDILEQHYRNCKLYFKTKNL